MQRESENPSKLLALNFLVVEHIFCQTLEEWVDQNWVLARNSNSLQQVYCGNYDDWQGAFGRNWHETLENMQLEPTLLEISYSFMMNPHKNGCFLANEVIS